MIGTPATVEPSERATRASGDNGATRASSDDGATRASSDDGATRASSDDGARSSSNYDGTRSSSSYDGAARSNGTRERAPSSSNERAASASGETRPAERGVDRSARLEAPPIAPEPGILERARPRDVSVMRERRWGLFAGGLALFASGYAVDVALTYGLGHQPAAVSLIPLAGPLIQFGDNWNMITPYKSGNAQIDVPANQRIDTANHGIATAAYVVLGVDFALQLAGLTMAVIGAASSHTHSYAAAPAPKRSWSLAPSGGGTALAVRF